MNAFVFTRTVWCVEGSGLVAGARFELALPVYETGMVPNSTIPRCNYDLIAILPAPLPSKPEETIIRRDSL